MELVKVPWTEDMGLLQRLTIYKAYWDDLNWFGHGLSEGYYVIGDGDYFSRHAQNLWLQMAYTYGIPAGVLSVVLPFALLYRQGKFLSGGRKNPYAVLPFLVLSVFLLFGLTEIVWNPGQLILFLVFFVQHPQMTKVQEPV